MISAEVRALRERWRSPEGRALGIEVARWLAGKGRRPPRGIGKIDGRIDLRGFAFPDARQVGTLRVRRSTFRSIEGLPEFESVRWLGIDFTGAIIRSARFFTSAIQNCRFDEADLFDWRLWDSRISDCTFVKADLQGSAIGTGNNDTNGLNVWTRVSFDRANLIGATVVECVFRDCTFRRAKLRNLRFSWVEFDGVVFDGLLDGVLFEGRKLQEHRYPGPMRNVDFRQARFRDCEFRAKLDSVLFESSPDIRIIRDYPAAMKRALELARESSDPEEVDFASYFEERLKLRSEEPYDSVFFLTDFTSDGFREMGTIFTRLLDRAEADLELRDSR